MRFSGQIRIQKTEDLTCDIRNRIGELRNIPDEVWINGIAYFSNVYNNIDDVVLSLWDKFMPDIKQIVGILGIFKADLIISVSADTIKYEELVISEIVIRKLFNFGIGISIIVV